MKFLGILTWLIMTVIGSALLHSWALSKMWHWFVSAQYGAGPSMGAWFGFAAIARLTLIRADESKSDEDADGVVSRMVRATIGHWIGILLALGATWLCGTTVGWVR